MKTFRVVLITAFFLAFMFSYAAASTGNAIDMQTTRVGGRMISSGPVSLYFFVGVVLGWLMFRVCCAVLPDDDEMISV